MHRNSLKKALFFLLLALYLFPCLALFSFLWEAAPAAAEAESGPLTAAFLLAYRNSCLLAAANLLLQWLVNVPAGLALAKLLPQRAANRVLALCLLLMLLPQQALLLPQYLVLDALHLLDRLGGLVLLSAFQPFLVLLYWAGFRQIETSLLEAAACEGATGPQIFRHICLPLLTPYLLAGSLLSVAESWAMLEQPLTFLQADTQPVLSTYFLQAANLRQTALAAVPMLLFFVVVAGVVQKPGNREEPEGGNAEEIPVTEIQRVSSLWDPI